MACFVRFIQPKVVKNLSPLSLMKGFPRYDSTDATDIHKPLSENDHITTEVINRNPRNLEQMCIAKKRKGFPLEITSREYYHKLFIEKSARYVTGRIEHSTGKTVVKASTSEWAIRKFLPSTKNVAAVENIGRILAQRCLECGILHVHVAPPPKGQEPSQMEKLFLTTLEKNGLKLQEEAVIERDPFWK